MIEVNYRMIKISSNKDLLNKLIIIKKEQDFWTSSLTTHFENSAFFEASRFLKLLINFSLSNRREIHIYIYIYIPVCFFINDNALTKQKILFM